jgi:hypothetical protein
VSTKVDTCARSYPGQIWRNNRNGGNPREPLMKIVRVCLVLLALWPAGAFAVDSDPPDPYVEGIQCNGNVSSSCELIRAHAGITVGKPLDEIQVDNARLRLETLPNFRTVEIHLVKGSHKHWVIVVIDVTEPNPITSAFAAQVTPLLQGGALGVDLKGASLPPTMRQDLVSGLTNSIVVRVTLASAGQPVAQRLVGFAIKYDLWEETFGVKVDVDAIPVSASTGQHLDEVIAMLTDLNLPRLFAVDAAAAGKSFELTAEILFDPIEKARMEEVRKWVAENNHSGPPDASRLSAGLPAPRSTSARLFNRIFEQYAAGASVAASWQQTVTSKPFKLEELQNGP